MTKENVCCPEFHTELWDEKTTTWEDKLFVTEGILQFLHMPLPGVFGNSVTKMMAEIEKNDARTDPKDYLMLAQDPSPWKSNLFINVTKEVPGLTNVRLSGTFMSKVFDGPFQNVPKFMKEMDSYVAEKGKKVIDYYFYYTYCPKCAQKYGHNYIVVFAKIN